MKVERGAGCVSGWFKCAGVSTTCVSVTLCRLAWVSGWRRVGAGVLLSGIYVDGASQHKVLTSNVGKKMKSKEHIVDVFISMVVNICKV